MMVFMASLLVVFLVGFINAEVFYLTCNSVGVIKGKPVQNC